MKPRDEVVLKGISVILSETKDLGGGSYLVVTTILSRDSHVVPIAPGIIRMTFSEIIEGW